MSSVLVTGANGFLGSIILRILPQEGYITKSLGKNSNSDYVVDLAHGVPRFNESFETVVHCAGKAHIVPHSNVDSQLFFDINVNGSKNLLKGLELRASLPRSFVFISTVAVYGIGRGILIDESTPLTATEPYGLSKIQAEHLIQDWCVKHNVIYSILRLPLIAGANPPGNLKSMIKGIKNGYYFNVWGGKARKSIVLADDVAKIIPKTAEVGGVYNLTDGYHPSFAELSELIAKQSGKNKPANIPNWLATIMAKTGDLLGSKAPINSDKLRKITSDLTFDDSKARQMLGWNPTPVLEGFKITENISAS